MPYVLPNPERYIGQTKFINAKGDHQCVEFVRQTLGLPPTIAWHKGAEVQGNSALPKGTAIATFVNGQYQQHGSTGMHAAIYLSQDITGDLGG